MGDGELCCCAFHGVDLIVNQPRGVSPHPSTSFFRGLLPIFLLGQIHSHASNPRYSADFLNGTPAALAWLVVRQFESTAAM